MSDNDTIVAQATPPGRGGVGILRISGFKAREVAETVLGKLPKPRYADYLPFKDADGSARPPSTWPLPWPRWRRPCLSSTPLSFDSGGVTTGPITVPFIMTLSARGRYL